MANKSIFDDSLISRMLDETFSGVKETQTYRCNQSLNSFSKILQDGGIKSSEIMEYPNFWRINFRNTPIDFPINWGLAKAAKELLLLKEMAFVSVDNDFHSLCQIFQAQILGVYRQGGHYHFFIAQAPDKLIVEFLNSNGHKISTQTVLSVNKKIAMAA